MSEVFFDELHIPRPDHNLGIGGGSHGQNTGRMIEKLEGLMLAEKPDMILVYGDTDSTLAGALAAVKLHIPVAHVEAGLRSFNRRMPEEINRILTDHVATFLFAPTILACNNLRKEGITEEKIFFKGDVMYDATLYYKEHARKPAWFDLLGLALNTYVLCTVHRAENTDFQTRMQGILDGLEGVNLPTILPLHPRTRNKIQEMKLQIPNNVHLVDPVGYLEMVWLEANCKLIVTDSGGVQKEAYFHQKPCVTLRDETEWVELVDGGFNQLAGTDAKKIERACEEQNAMDFSKKIYGHGESASQIVKTLLNK
jgi:UDP-GlcNAc3NAcA epimerase